MPGARISRPHQRASTLDFVIRLQLFALRARVRTRRPRSQRQDARPRRLNQPGSKQKLDTFTTERLGFLVRQIRKLRMVKSC
jgi:hypothetical protein